MCDGVLNIHSNSGVIDFIIIIIFKKLVFFIFKYSYARCHFYDFYAYSKRTSF